MMMWIKDNNNRDDDDGDDDNDTRNSINIIYALSLYFASKLLLPWLSESFEWTNSQIVVKCCVKFLETRILGSRFKTTVLPDI